MPSAPASMHSTSSPSGAVTRSDNAVLEPSMEVGMIEAQQESGFSTDGMTEIIEKMRLSAAKAGCDGLLIQGPHDSAIGSGGVMLPIKGYRGSCLVFVSGPPPHLSAATQATHIAKACTPNATQLCYGPGACKGAQACLADGSGFSQCACD